MHNHFKFQFKKSKEASSKYTKIERYYFNNFLPIHFKSTYYLKMLEEVNSARSKKLQTYSGKEIPVRLRKFIWKSTYLKSIVLQQTLSI